MFKCTTVNFEGHLNDRMLRRPGICALTRLVACASTTVDCALGATRSFHMSYMRTAASELTSSFRDQKHPTEGKNTKDDEPKIDLDEIDEALKNDSNTGKEMDDKFMNFKQKREGYIRSLTRRISKDIFQQAAHDRSYIFNWKAAVGTLAVGGVALIALLYMREKRLAESEKRRKIMAGKARIGGPWELVNTEGKLEGSEQLKGNWLLIYFGFTHCPDVCPDEIEKMIKVVDILDADPQKKFSIIPLFISVDPERDTIERVKEYCLEFSPKLRGYTGSKEQVDKVAKTFRVYYSQGPRSANAPDDYIVDHSVIMYLVDPDGNFHDYYGQNRNETEIANVIKMKVLKHELTSRKKPWI
ncbi:Protein SCO1 -like protein, mitochondrial [Toxocara canis]|uniref:Protein SCO1-like protein, mitochondrial n=1 Tax=Toxocara canis TaxID=6265 RepID=A0A0B2VP62_TOXCA|nr:Protein SCO1 -like protein, mitochondrial [Toxocara canis]